MNNEKNRVDTSDLGELILEVLQKGTNFFFKLFEIILTSEEEHVICKLFSSPLLAREMSEGFK